MDRVLCSLIFAIVVVFITNDCLAQAQNRCATMDIYLEKMQSDPIYKSNMQQLERIVDAQKQASNQPPWNLSHIPVVFHIVHNGTPIGVAENISTSLIMAQFNQLNDDFRRMNLDANNTPASFVGLAADTEIGFCFAEVDPNGNSTNGINRVNLNNLPGVDINDCWSTDYIDDNIVTALNWDRDDYLNIYCVPRIDDDFYGPCYGNGLLGYAQFPNGPAATDAVVNAYFTFGSIANPNPVNTSYNIGRTVTHEVGHWFGLYHIWGDDCGGNGSTCSGTDFVNDTPNQRCSTSGCPTGVQTDSCTPNSPGIMYMNYMDYSNDDCLNMFSNGQALRMQSIINTYRPSILNSSACGNLCPDVLNVNNTLIPTGVYQANITTYSSKTVPAGHNVEFYAGDCIELQNNFFINQAADFEADIQPCD